jgi:Methyltransferase domain
MKILYLLKGLFKNIPGVEKIYNFHKATGGTNDARYCYSVWLRHIIHAHENGYRQIPNQVAELGPGDSLGIGISALLSGAEKCVALDIVRYTDAKKNLEIFDELITLFRNKTPVPRDPSFSQIQPELNDYSFPHHILTDSVLAASLHPDRLAKIRRAIEQLDNPDFAAGPDCMICYKVPWTDTAVIETGKVDMIISQAVLQHIDDLELTYLSMNRWLKDNGYISHCVDLRSMGTSDNWYGHWSYNDLQWKIVKGRKKYLINRLPYSAHIALARKYGFDIRNEKLVRSAMPDRKELAPEFRSFDEKDLTTSNLFLQARKAVALSILNGITVFASYISDLEQPVVLAMAS